MKSLVESKTKKPTIATLFMRTITPAQLGEDLLASILDHAVTQMMEESLLLAKDAAGWAETKEPIDEFLQRLPFIKRSELEIFIEQGRDLANADIKILLAIRLKIAQRQARNAPLRAQN